MSTEPAGNGRPCNDDSLRERTEQCPQAQRVALEPGAEQDRLDSRARVARAAIRSATTSIP